MDGGRGGPQQSWHTRQEGSDLSNLSSTTLGGNDLTSPLSSFGRRPRYQRLGSEGTPAQIIRENEDDTEEEEDLATAVRNAGLGIQHVGREHSVSPDVPGTPAHARSVSIQRVSSPSIRQSYLSPRTDSAPGSSNPLVSPRLEDTRHLSSTKTAYDPANTPDDFEDDITRAKRQSDRVSSNYPYRYDDTEPLRRPKSNYSVRSLFETNDFHPHACPTAKSFYQGRFNWLAISIVLIALFSTAFSGIFLGIALRAPRWGRAIRDHGALSPAGADILTTVFAKLIELSFVTVFVTFLGQVLSRRAFNSGARGVTIAEITMRNWVMQPGSMITHYETVRYAALSFLGLLSLSVALFAMLYSTASSALVQPQLKFGGWDERMLQAVVKSSFANVNYLQKTCQNPIQISEFDTNYDLQNVGNTCLEIDHAAQGFHNYKQYLTYWANLVATGQANTVDQKARPPGFALHNETVSVNATWIDVIDMDDTSKTFNRTVNNVTLAFPHAGVVQAGYDPTNNIVQPTDLDGQGIYNVKASVPSPYINVLCANFQKEEYSHFVYETMPNVTLNVTRDFANLSTWWYTTGVNWTYFNDVPIGNNSLDKVFGWETTADRPVFYKFPIDFNTLLNNTRSVYARDSIYLLGKGDSSKSSDYFMCKTKAGMTPVCSTQYEATNNGGSLAAHCEDDSDKLQYLRSNSSRAVTTSLDWYDVGTEAFNSLSLGNGVTDGAAANARLLTQLQLLSPQLNPALPSPAEAISVLVGCTLLMGAVDTPFVEFWNYTVNELDTGVYQQFNASVRAQEYASGGTADYQKAFYVVLFAVFLLNLFMLIYFIVNNGLVTDFSEPPNLFSLAVNSPPSRLLAGSCGAGPVGPQFKVNWGIATEGEHLFMTDRRGGATSGYQTVASDINRDDPASAGLGRGATFEMDSVLSPGGSTGKPERKYSKFGKHLTMLNKRKSFL